MPCTGSPFTLTQQARDVFMSHTEQNRRRMNFEEDFVVIHDPQPAGLVASKAGSASKWVWRCHIDLSHPNEEVWKFLQPMVEQYDAAVFSSPAFARQLGIPQALFYPCIDPLSEKNKDLEDSYIQEVCDNFGVDRSRPVVTQISRFDRLKDPLGVIQAYKMAKKYVDFQLVLAGGGASDDPEGAIVLKEVQEAAAADPDIIILELAAMVRAGDQCSAAGVYHRCSKVIEGGIRAHGYRSIVEVETDDCKRGWRYSNTGDRQAYRHAGPFCGRLRLSDPVPSHASRIRYSTGEKWT